MRITYHGPHDGVELAALTNVVVARGQTIEVDDELGASLVEQATWDTSREELLAWLNRSADLVTRVEWAERLLVAEQNGAQRTEVLEAITHWLNSTESDAGRTDPVENPPDPPAEQTDSPATPARTRKGAK